MKSIRSQALNLFLFHFSNFFCFLKRLFLSLKFQENERIKNLYLDSCQSLANKYRNIISPPCWPKFPAQLVLHILDHRISKYCHKQSQLLPEINDKSQSAFGSIMLWLLSKTIILSKVKILNNKQDMIKKTTTI